MPIDVIYLDLDGVVSNFIKSAAKLYGYEEHHLLEKWSPGVCKLESVLGVTEDYFIESIRKAGKEFWSDMEVYDHAEELYKLCTGYAKTYICTAPLNWPECLAGKMEFLQKWHGDNFNNYIITEHKELLANERCVLIDDLEKNIEKFSDNNGKTILFPNISNKNHFRPRISYTKEKLEEYSK